MRHFKKLSKGFLDDLTAYVDSYMSLQGTEHDSIVEAAYEAIDEMYEETRAFNFAGGFPLYNNRPRNDVTSYSAPPPCAAPMPCEAQIVLPEKQPTFQENLFAIIDEHGYKDSAIYKKADIDRRLFSKIRADVDYHPSKNTAIKLCLALGLAIADTERLLETAGYCLSLSDTGDLVVRYCIEHRIFNLIEVNTALDYFGEETL